IILNQRFDALNFEDDQRDWADWLKTVANDLRAAMLAHREGARVVAGAHLNVATTLLKLINLNIRVLHNAGFSYVEASRISTTVVTFTFGFTIEEQSPPPPVADISELIPANPSPEIAAFVQALAEGGIQEYLPGDARFNACLSFIISGVRAELKPSG
ncbi:MAG: TetR/AcrR family transcriptional regulator C-terminal domain-containing protein, partial [Chloroflexota bacterium]